MRLRAALLMLILGTGCGDRGSPGPFLVETANAVRLNGAPAAVAPPRQLVLSNGDVIDVEPGGVARVVYADGTRILLVGRKDQPARLKVEAPRSDTARVLLKLLTGTLSFVVPKNRPAGHQYHVEALSTLTVVRGTSGRIVTGQHHDQVAVAEGVVEVSRPDGAEKTIVKELEELVASGTAPFVKRPYTPSAESELPLYDTKIDRTRHGF